MKVKDLISFLGTLKGNTEIKGFINDGGIKSANIEIGYSSDESDILRFVAHEIQDEDFEECPECAAKPGSPDLCDECLERRR